MYTSGASALLVLISSVVLGAAFGCKGEIKGEPSPPSSASDAASDGADSGVEAPVPPGHEADAECLPIAAPAAPPQLSVNTWVRISPNEDHGVPNVQWEAGGAYDSVNQVWVHHGGHERRPSQQGFHTLTLDLDTGAWAQVVPSNSPPGACNIDGAFTFDRHNRRIMRFPGAQLGHGYQYSRSNRLKDPLAWSFDAATGEWMNMRPHVDADPLHSERAMGGSNASVTFDGKHGLYFHFGGIGRRGGTDTLRAYDLYDNRLDVVDLAGSPSGRDHAALAYSETEDVLILFGGQYVEDDTTYLFRPGAESYEQLVLDPRPPVNKIGPYSTIPNMACETTGPLCVLLIWRDDGHEIWLFDASNPSYRRLETTNELPASRSRSRNLHYLPDRRAFALHLQRTDDNTQEVYLFAPEGMTPPPTALPPRDLKVSTRAGGADLTWTAAEGAARYRVYRGEGERRLDAELSMVGETRCPEFHDEGLREGTIYHYEVRSVDANGAEAPEVAIGRTRPRVSIDPVASVVSAQEVRLRWASHPADDVVGYVVERSKVEVRTLTEGEPRAYRDNDPAYDEPLVVRTHAFLNWERITPEPIAEPSLVDRGVRLDQPGEEAMGHRTAVYAYAVRAVNALGVESGASPYVLTLPSEPRDVVAQELSDGRVKVSWRSLEDSVTSYRLYKSVDKFVIERLPMEVTDTERVFEGPFARTDRIWVSPVDVLGQEGVPSSPVWLIPRYPSLLTDDVHP